MYIFGRFDEISAITKPKMMTFSITGSQIFFVDFVIYSKNNLSFTPLPCPYVLSSMHGREDSRPFFHEQGYNIM